MMSGHFSLCLLSFWMNSSHGDKVSTILMFTWSLIDQHKDQVKELKQKAFKNPKKNLFPNIVKRFEQVKTLFDYLQNLRYQDQPDYKYIKEKLNEMRHIAMYKNIS